MLMPSFLFAKVRDSKRKVRHCQQKRHEVRGRPWWIMVKSFSKEQIEKVLILWPEISKGPEQVKAAFPGLLGEQLAASLMDGVATHGASTLAGWRPRIWRPQPRSLCGASRSSVSTRRRPRSLCGASMEID